MAKRRGRHRKQGGRTTPPGTRPGARPEGAPRTPPAGAEPELVRTVRRAVEAGVVPTLEMASTFVEAGTPRPLDSFPAAAGSSNASRTERTERTDLAELLAAFLEAPFPVMRVLATAMLPMLDDDLLARRIGRQLEATRIPAAPVWLDDLADPEPAGTAMVIDPLGDGDNVLVSVSWRGRRHATAIVYIDHNVGTQVKDAFVVPGPLDATLELYRQLSDRDGVIEMVEPAAARARIAEAITVGEQSIPPFETETWPGVRPLVEWWISLLPAGGTGYEHREWSPPELDAVIDAFADSPFAAELSIPPETVRSLADPLVWFAAGSMPGDPLRWSPVSVEIALADVLPRKARLALDELRQLPDVLAAMVRYAHRERHVDARDTAETLGSIEQHTPEFLTAIEEGPADPVRNAIRNARIVAGLDPDGDDWPDVDMADDTADDDLDDLDDVFPRRADGSIDYEALLDIAEHQLIDEIGGAEAVGELDDEPLADEPFDRGAVPGDLRDLVDDVVRRIDDVCAADLDGEMGTICRRYVAELVAHEPVVFRRSPRADLIAAGVVWAAVKLQLHELGRPLTDDVPTQKQLAETMGVAAGSMSGRAQTVGRALERATSVTTAGPWHSVRRSRWLEQLAQLARLRAEITDDDL
jgi:hypothetical protein